MEIHWHETEEALSRHAADFLLERALAVAGRGLTFTLALSGGRSPGRLYSLLASPPFARVMPWPWVHLFWGDERCVPPHHPDSNFALAHRTLISRVPIPAQNVHRILGESTTPEDAARQYEGALRRFFRRQGVGEIRFPVMDLILLGMGTDGHTASLFPGSPALEAPRRWTAAVEPPQEAAPAVARVTVTLPVINAARCVAFLVPGTDKGALVRRVLQGPTGASPLPAEMVRPAGDLIWFLQGGGETSG